MAWKKGESGNKNGRPPKAASLNQILRHKLDLNVPAEIARAAGRQTGQSWKNAITDRLLLLALEGDMRAIQFIFERVDGRTPQRVDITQRLYDMAAKHGLDADAVLAEAERIAAGLEIADDD